MVAAAAPGDAGVMATAAATPAPGRSGWTGGRIAAVTAGSLIALISLALAVGGAVLALAFAFARDDDGWFTSPTEHLQTPTAALTAERLQIGDLTGDPDGWVGVLDARVRVTAELADSSPVFVGIAREADLDAYLAGVAHDEVEDAAHDELDRTPGSAAAADPRRQDFWVARATGAGEQTAEWEIGEGEWAVAVMRADGTPGVAADVSVGAKADWLLWVALGLLGAGLLGLGGGSALIWGGIHAAERDGVPAPPAPPAPGGGPESAAGAGVPAHAAAVSGAAAQEAHAQPYPVDLQARLDTPLSPWLWLVKWFLAIPHYVVLAFLWAAFAVLWVVALVAIVATGRYPRAIFDFNVGVLRWMWRVGWYATSAIATDRYPPFTLAPAGYPVEIDIPYPERLSRGKALVKWWLLALPHYAILGALAGGWSWWWFETAAPSVLVVLVLVAGVVLLFTGRYPRDVFRLVVGINRWALRVVAYAALMRDEYPPFRLEDPEPDAAPAG